MTDKGAGTDVCKKCEGDKEPTRHNSNYCRACDAATPSSKRRRTAKQINLEIEPELFDALRARAVHRDMTVREFILAVMRKTYL